ncbi:MAG: RHS repeat-associated core domain-containing protein [Idiomarina sp.]|nr:RHS repeat-associated core domain-containing protein [Idiomarina sp.]
MKQLWKMALPLASIGLLFHPTSQANTVKQSERQQLSAAFLRAVEPQYIPAPDMGIQTMGAGSEDFGAFELKLMTELALARMEVSEHITPETSELFGERIDLNLGAVTFQHTDVSLAGNSAIPVEIRRTYRGSKNNHGNNSSFGDWTLDIPSITTTTLKYTEEDLSYIPSCRFQLEPNFVDTGYATVGPMQYWSGVTLDIPGVTNQKIRAYGSERVADNWKVECLPQSHDHAFKVTSPEGVVYIFDMVRLIPASLVPVERETEIIDEGLYHIELLPTYTINIQVTEIRDRFGNTVTYEYDETMVPLGTTNQYMRHSNRLERIYASDGREIEIFYEYGSTDRISRIEADGRTWEYEYELKEDKLELIDKDILKTVTRPDGRSWSFDMAFDLFGGYQNSNAGGLGDCQSLVEIPNQSTLVHPDGAVLELTQQMVQIGRGIPFLPNQNDGDNFGRHQVSRCMQSMAVTEKRLDTGEELLIWQYDYSQNAGYPKQTTGSTPEPQELTGLPVLPGISVIQEPELGLLNLRSTTVNNPDNSKTIHVFDRRLRATEGEEVLTVYFDTDTTTVLQAVERTHIEVDKTGDVRMVSCKPSQYPVSSVDTDPCEKQFDNPDKHNTHVYLASQKTIMYDGGTPTTFTTSYSEYNLYGQPEEISEVGPSGARYTRLHYQHDEDAWVLNLPIKSERSENGYSWTTAREMSYYDVNSSYPLLLENTYAFGELVQTNTYYPDGMLKRKTYNAPNRWVEYANYVRGVPTLITLPGRYDASQTQTAALDVNSRGEIIATTNFNQITTLFEYDIMGRLTRITPVSPWQATNITYSYSSNRFIQTIRQGAMEKRIEMDALFRPLLTRERDMNTNWTSYVNQQFNAYNEVEFVSFPSASPIESRGTRTYFDGLQRPYRMLNTADGSNTYYNYLSGNRVEQITARGDITTTTYAGYGAPSQDSPIQIVQPEGVETSLVYNLFGNVVSVAQGGQTEMRAYDARQRLCRISRADVGEQVFKYNAVGNLIWQAQGDVGSSGSCDYLSVPESSRTLYTYDNIGNIREVLYPDNHGNIEYTYDAQGQLTRLRSGTNRWEYTYNSLGLVSQETLHADGHQFGFEYHYNTLGHTASLTYPSGRTMSYLPDAFGRPTQAGTYAQQADYRPSGQLVSFTYGNGLNFIQELDNLLRPQRRTVSGASDLFSHHYSYDANSNITHISDEVLPHNSLTLTYDGLERLLGASGGWGSDLYSYDPLGNITQRILNDEALNYQYNQHKQLTSVSGFEERDFVYDDRGNVTHNGERAFNYNHAGRLVSSGSIQFEYDGYGRRIKKSDGSQVTYSLYNHEGRLLGQFAAGGHTDYIYLGAQQVARHTDNVHPTDRPGYTGHMEDEDLQLTYMQQRYYDPLIGRFYANDPVGFQVNNPMMFNRYAYANNNPYKYIDPDGREVKLQWHEVTVMGIGTRKNHTLLTITPEDPQHFNNVGRISSLGELTNSQGNRYGTMGAGPNLLISKLVSAYNRPNDSVEREGGIVISLPSGMNENQFVDKLIELDSNYRDNLRYSLFPDGVESFNSNSYVSGLLNAAGVDISKLQVPNAPGFDKPIPEEYFERKE